MRFGYVHFAFLGPESVSAAEASECAAEQDRFWAYHDALFANQAGENRGAFDDALLQRFAADVGLDEEAFASCMASDRYLSVVTEESEWVRSLGVQSTPTFLVNDRPLVGAQPFEAFAQAIEQELAE